MKDTKNDMKSNSLPTSSPTNSADPSQSSTTETLDSSWQDPPKSSQSSLESPNSELSVKTLKPKPTSNGDSQRSFNSPSKKTHSQSSMKPKKDRKKDSESLSDPSAWPTLQQAQSPESKTTSDEIKPQIEPIPHDLTAEGATGEQDDSNGSKKKGINWVPLKDIQPAPATFRSQSGGSRGRGRRRDDTRQNTSHNRIDRSTGSSDRTYDRSSSGERPSDTYRDSNRGGGSYQQRTSPTSSSSSEGRSSYRGSNSRRGGHSGAGGRGGQRSYGNNVVPQVPPMGYPNFVPFIVLEGDQLREAVLHQIEYYFSIENLCKDVYLRQLMDDQGWIPLSVVLNFNRVKTLEAPYELVVDVLKNSTVIELKDDKIRKLDDWKTWIFPKKDEQKESTSTDQPLQLSHLDVSQNSSTTSSTHSSSTLSSQSTQHSSSSFSSNPSTSSPSSTDTTTPAKPEKKLSLAETLKRQQQQQQTAQQQHAPSRGPPPAARLEVSDKKNAPSLQSSTPVVTESTSTSSTSLSSSPAPAAAKKNEEEEWQTVGSRTRKPPSKPEKKSHDREREPRHRREDKGEKPKANGVAHPPQQQRVERVERVEDPDDEGINDEYFGNLIVIIQSTTDGINNAPNNMNGTLTSRRTRQELDSTINEGLAIYEQTINPPSKMHKHYQRKRIYFTARREADSTGLDGAIAWVQGSFAMSTDFQPITFQVAQSAAFDLLRDAGFIQWKYPALRLHCLRERKRLGSGKSSEMETLYRFWSYFLRDHFHRATYYDFKSLAIEDAKAGSRYGLDTLFKYFSYGLEVKFKLGLYEDFQDLTVFDVSISSLYGLEKFWAFLKYRKDTTKLDKKPEIVKLLNQYKTLDDFRSDKLHRSVIKHSEAQFPTLSPPLGDSSSTTTPPAPTSPTSNGTVSDPSSSSNAWFQKRNHK